MEPEPHRLTATDALQLIQSNKLTVESYARSLLSRIDSRDAAVKAWVHLNPDAVLEQARLLDKIPADQRGPLHGVPIAVKDVMYTKGAPPPSPPFSVYLYLMDRVLIVPANSQIDMPTEHNSPLYKDSHVPVDAAVVATLRAAGALIFGMVSLPDFPFLPFYSGDSGGLVGLVC